ncbi:MAG: exonuclease domain-containing protein [Candidatus Obscuribacterales bacterium]
MKLPKIANVVDIEGRLIEIGLTTVSLADRRIVQTYSLPLKPEDAISPEILELTGWTMNKLKKQGLEKSEVVRRMETYGFRNRLLVTDASNEIPLLEKCLQVGLSPHRLNVAILFALSTGKDINCGLEAMLSHFGLEFEGRLHSGADDSRNIARLFLIQAPKKSAGQ